MEEIKNVEIAENAAAQAAGGQIGPNDHVIQWFNADGCHGCLFERNGIRMYKVVSGDQLGFVAPYVGARDGYAIYYKNTQYNSNARNTVLYNASQIEVGDELIVDSRF